MTLTNNVLNWAQLISIIGNVILFLCFILLMFNLFSVISRSYPFILTMIVSFDTARTYEPSELDETRIQGLALEIASILTNAAGFMLALMIKRTEILKEEQACR